MMESGACIVAATGLRVLVRDDDPGWAARAERAVDTDEAIRSHPEQMLGADRRAPGGFELVRIQRADDAARLMIEGATLERLPGIVDARDAGFDDLYFKPIALAELTHLALDVSTRTRRWAEIQESPSRGAAVEDKQ